MKLRIPIPLPTSLLRKPDRPRTLRVRLASVKAPKCGEPGLKLESSAHRSADRVARPPEQKSGIRLRRTEAREDGPVCRVYRFPSEYESVSLFVGELLAPQADRLGPEERNELSLALRELLLNAIEHGNLEFGYEEKSRCLDEGIWKERVADRQRDLAFSGRKVNVLVTWESDRVLFVIRDEGAGFDWQTLPDPTSPENALLAHGRGILMARLSVDSLRYNEFGNEVTLVKLLKGVADSKWVAS